MEKNRIETSELIKAEITKLVILKSKASYLLVTTTLSHNVHFREILVSAYLPWRKKFQTPRIHNGITKAIKSEEEK